MPQAVVADLPTLKPEHEQGSAELGWNDLEQYQVKFQLHPAIELQLPRSRVKDLEKLKA